MSLISDPDFLIHNIRLGYLRNVDDPYGPRLISFDPSYRSNAYVVNAGMADMDRWPELSMTSSPVPSDDEAAPSTQAQGRRPAGFPGATGLKYTTTIMGPSRAGALGLRVNGKRDSISSRPALRRSLSNKRPQEVIVNERKPDDPDATPTIPSSASPHKNTQQRILEDSSPIQGSQMEIKAPIPIVTITQGSATPSPAPSPAPVPPAPAANVPIPFIPKFKGAAEMEARRQLRMRNRVPPGGMRRPVQTSANLNPELSSSSSSSSPSPLISEAEDEVEEIAVEEDDEFDDDVADVIDDIDDEFDPEFAGSRGTILDSASDGLSLLSDSQSLGMSTSSYSVLRSSLVLAGSTRANGRLSPVRETNPSDENFTSPHTSEKTGDSSNIEQYFEMVTPPPLEKGREAPNVKVPNRLDIAVPQPLTIPLPSPAQSLFAKRPVSRATSGKSALTAMLAETSNETSENPFAELYSAISARSDSDSLIARVFFPHAQKPAGQPMNLKVRKDATMEEVLGFALWTYWEEGWQPRIDKDLEGEDDPRWSTVCSALGWILRIAEEDGEVDEDFPPPDRTGRISKFNFDAYAVLEASASQVQQNKIIESKIQRRLSRIVLKKKKSTELLKAANQHTGGLTIPSDPALATSAALGSTLGSSLGMFPSSLGPSNSGPPQFLRIRIADTADAGHVSTTIQASGGMYMAEVLELVCQKRKLPNPKDYALVLDITNPGGPNTRIYIPVDRTVKSLQGKRDLMLIKNSMLRNYGVDMGKRGMERSTDPNASILKRGSEVPEQVMSSLFIGGQYKRYTVYRKVPMLVTRSARHLAIDGGYIHIMPQANKAKNVFESGKTLNYDIKSVVACQQSSKNSATFKLVVTRGGVKDDQKEGDREGRNKRYEFEAESPQLAAEIVATIRELRTTMGLDRANTVKQSRRSRQVS